LFADFSAVDRCWNTEQQLSVVHETISSLSLPEFTRTHRDWSLLTAADDIRNYVCTLIGRRTDLSASCAAQLTSRLFRLFCFIIYWILCFQNGCNKNRQHLLVITAFWFACL